MLLYRHASGDRYATGLNGPYKVEISAQYNDPYRVRTNINGFGNGMERNSSFSIFTTWTDIRQMIDLLAKAGHPDATRMVEDLAAMKRVRAALEPTIKDEEPEQAEAA